MSGKSFLFFAMAILLILLALGQSIALHVMSTKIADQMEKDTRLFSKELVDMVTRRAVHQWSSTNTGKEDNRSSDHKEHSKAFIIAKKVQDKRKADSEHKRNLTKQEAGSKRKRETTIIIDSSDKCVFDDEGQLLVGDPEICDQLKLESMLNDEDNITDDINKGLQIAKLLKNNLDKIDIRIEQTVSSNQSPKDIAAIFGNTVAGLHHSSLPLSSEALALVQSLKRWNLVIVAIFVVIGLVAAYWISHHFSQPLQKLAQAYRRVGQGELSTRLQPQGVQEVKAVFEGFNAMLSQISDMQEQAEVLREQTHLAEVGEVARGLAHALRNPIHSMGLNLEKINDSFPSGTTNGDSDAGAIILEMKKKLEQMDRTIRSLLTLSATEVHRNEKILLFPIVQDILLELKTGAPKDLQFDISGLDKEAWVLGAVAEWRSVLHAIIVNAVDASPPGAKVIIACQKNENELQIIIRDEGEGIDEAILATVFEAHVSTKAEGSGMGLYITERLLRLFYKGKIQLTNLPQGGCEAKIRVNQAC